MIQVKTGIYRRGEAGWDEARLPWNRISDQRPEIVVRAASVEDVKTALHLARAQGLRLAVQSSGHGAGQRLGTLEGAVLLDMSQLQSITVDSHTQSARVEAGALWEQVAAAAAPHGLAGLAGSSPNVAVAGFCLGGGAGFLGRKYGFAANNVRAIEVVLPDGTELRTDLDHEPELFWALRGGGGSFAIVTALELQLFPVETAYAGAMLWPVERAPEIWHAWFGWTKGLADDTTTAARLLQFPPLPDVPEPMRGRAFAGFSGAVLAPTAEAERIVAPLRALRPEIDVFAEVPAPALTRIHMDPEPPLPGVANGWLLESFDADGVDAVLSVLPPTQPSALLNAEIRHLGGAFSRPSPHHGSVGAPRGEHIVFGVGMGLSPEMIAAIDGSLDALAGAVGPWLAEHQQPINFSDRPRPPEDHFAAADLQRLRQARRRYDPEGILLSNRPLD